MESVRLLPRNPPRIGTPATLLRLRARPRSPEAVDASLRLELLVRREGAGLGARSPRRATLVNGTTPRLRLATAHVPRLLTVATVGRRRQAPPRKVG